MSSAPTPPSAQDQAPVPPPSDPKPDARSLPAAPSATPDQPAASAVPTAPADDVGELKREEVNEEGEEEEEGECGFCLFMKGGGCKDAFVAWENCVEDSEKSGEDIVEKCSEVTALLKKCMDAHADYYEPILRAEQALVDSVADAAAATNNGDSEDQKEGKDS
ncbi:hypothetical protein Cni_G29058 [Canna indica]|uniref:GCK domain-containing protein n=1 Tax=Canna indica TaxID=4628 RepID=A0AAQ3L464_9LILI|nr:hypothetical protein Cni_G29058 [Canna indica]